MRNEKMKLKNENKYYEIYLLKSEHSGNTISDGDNGTVLFDIIELGDFGDLFFEGNTGLSCVKKIRKG